MTARKLTPIQIALRRFMLWLLRFHDPTAACPKAPPAKRFLKGACGWRLQAIGPLSGRISNDMILKCAVIGAFLSLAVTQQSDIDKGFAEYERAWANADKNIIATLAAEDLVWITRGGKALNKQEFLQVFNPKSGTKNIRDKKVRVYGDVAVMTYAGDEGSSAVRRTIVWNKTTAGWKIVSVQATPIQQ